MRSLRRSAALLAALLLASCAPEPVPADPAIWLVEGPGGQKAWLFGTIHGLERPALWKTPPVAQALGAADTVIVEVAGLEDAGAMAKTFKELAHRPGQPPLADRVRPGLRKGLSKMLAEGGLEAGAFADVETWAAALTLARAASSKAKSEYGIDRAILAEAQDKRLVELEGAAGQLGIFDKLPEREQRDLLEAVIADTGAPGGGSAELAAAWRKGDMAPIEAATRRGLLADRELRAVLFTARNRRWSGRVQREMEAGIRPFVAVGAAHMAGPDGLPALLEAQGYAVTRLR